MKYISLFAMLLCLAACSKEANIISVDEIEERAEAIQTAWDLDVYVSYVDHSAATCEKVYMNNVQVGLIKGKVSMTNFRTDQIIKSRKTDVSGRAILDSVEKGAYSVYVINEYGQSIKHIDIGDANKPFLNFEFVK